MLFNEKVIIYSEKNNFSIEEMKDLINYTIKENKLLTLKLNE